MVHANKTSAPPILRRALQEFLQHRQTDHPISIVDMMQRTRYALPDLVLTDDELEQAIAEEIVDRHGNIAFDRHDISHLLPPQR